MLRDHFKLIFIVLITSSVLSQEQEQKYLFVGHAYGAPDQKDKKIDPYLTDFLTTNDINFDKLVLGGDFIYDCDDIEELNNFNLFFNQYKPYFILGNHDICPELINFSINTFGGDNYFKKIDSNLLLFINTSFENKDKIKKTISYINHKIDSIKPNNVLLFTHQVIFSKNDFYLRTNSRTYYDYGNKFYDQIFKKYYNSKYNFYFFSGDIGAFPYTPYAFYDNSNNFNFYAAGLGNGKHNKGILLKLDKNVAVQFVDLVKGTIESKNKYSKIKVQLYQLPKLLASKVRNFLKKS
jgi:hypothetical protein